MGTFAVVVVVQVVVVIFVVGTSFEASLVGIVETEEAFDGTMDHQFAIVAVAVVGVFVVVDVGGVSFFSVVLPKMRLFLKIQQK